MGAHGVGACMAAVVFFPIVGPNGRFGRMKTSRITLSTKIMGAHGVGVCMAAVVFLTHGMPRFYIIFPLPSEVWGGGQGVGQYAAVHCGGRHRWRPYS